jgi:type II secretion system protein D
MQRFLLLCFLSVLPSLCFAQQPANAANDEDPPVDALQLMDGDMNQLLVYYEKLSGKILIRDANLQNIPNLRIIVPSGLPRSQALRLIESTLVLNGCAIVPGEDNTVKMISTAGKNPRSEGIAIYANLADLPKGDQIISYYMPLRYISASEAVAVLQSNIMPHSAYGAIVPVAHAQSIVVTDNAATVRQLAKLKDLIDVPPAKLSSQFVTLQRADAERVAESIKGLLESRKAKAQSAPGAASGQAAQGADGTMNERNLVAGDVELLPDARTNRILVITRPVNFEYIKDLIEEFDRAVTLTSPYERPLKYVMASEVLPVLETLLMESDKNGQSASGSSATGQPQRTRPSPAQSGSSNNSNRANTDRTLQENQDTAPEAIMVGKTRLVADKQANSIIVIGPPESVDKAHSILDKLDKKPMQVYLSTVIGQLTLGDGSELAVDLLQKFSHAGDFGVASSSKASTDGFLPNPKELINPAAFVKAAQGLSIYGTIGSALDYYVKALESTSRFKVISRPSVYTANNKVAVISSGQRIAVPSSTLSSLNNMDTGSVVSNIDYTDVLLKLEVVPLINSEREVTLQIKQTNDSVVGSQLISGNSIPTIGTQAVDTTITVPNKATVVLGGLISEDQKREETGIPFLKDIPGLGYLFKGTKKEKSRTELIIMIQPVVVGDNDELSEASQNEENLNQVGKDAHNFSKNAKMLDNERKPEKKPEPQPANAETDNVESAVPHDKGSDR